MTLQFSSREIWAQSRMPKPSTRLADYATPDEIADIRARLITRFRSASGTHEDIRFKRSCIRQALRQIDKGRLPANATGAEDLLATLRERYEAAKADAHNVPDDAAWSRELQRRAELQVRYGVTSSNETLTKRKQAPHGHRGTNATPDRGMKYGTPLQGIRMDEPDKSEQRRPFSAGGHVHSEGKSK